MVVGSHFWNNNIFILCPVSSDGLVWPTVIAPYSILVATAGSKAALECAVSFVMAGHALYNSENKDKGFT